MTSSLSSQSGTAPDSNDVLLRAIDELRNTTDAHLRLIARCMDKLLSAGPPARGSSHGESARVAFAGRRSRDRIFGDHPGIFGEPVWDMLLFLFGETSCDRHISVSSLCSAAYVPSSTALRCVNYLEESALVQRRADPRDGRRTFLLLTDKARLLMERAMA